MSKLTSPTQQLILKVAGQKPTIPTPSTILPNDSRFNIESDIMIGQFAYNIIGGDKNVVIARINKTIRWLKESL